MMNLGAMMDGSRMKLRRFLPALFLVLVTLLAYTPAIKHGGFFWDDEQNVTNSPLLRSASGLRDIWTRVGPRMGGSFHYYPLTYTTFWIEYQLWGLSPAGYHLDNVLLHALNAVLVWIILARLRVPGALLAAAIFALHPVHVESVAWITERKNVMSVMFYLLSMLSFIRFFGLDGRREETRPGPEAGRRLDYYLGLALFFCGLASKTAIVTLPAAILLLLWWKNGRIGLKNTLMTAPLFMLAVLCGLVTTFVEKYQVLALGKEWELSPIGHILLAGRILWFYAGKLLWPHPLMFVYPRWVISPAAWPQYLFPICAITVMAVLWMLRGKIGRGPLTAVLFFAGTLAPVLGFLNIFYMRYSYVGDHFQYLASLGLITLCAAGAAESRLRLGRAAARYLLAAATALLLTFGALTWRQTGLYSSWYQLWLDSTIKNPDAWAAQNNWGLSLFYQGKYEEAIPHYLEILRVKPDYPLAHNNLGLALAALGRLDEAVAHYRKALHSQFDYADAHNNLAIALAALGKREEAVVHFREALRLRPDYTESYNNLGTTLYVLGRTEEAAANYREALSRRPDYAEAHNNLGVALAALGRTTEAVFHYRKALRIRQDYPEAHSNLGAALDALGRRQEALIHYRAALSLRPDYPEAHNNLGLSLAALGSTQEAIGQYREALRSRPDYAEAHNNLGLALSALGRRKEAIVQYREALRLRPDFRLAAENLALAGKDTP